MDPHGSALILVGGIWIEIQGRAKITHEKEESEDVSCCKVLDVLFRGLKAVAWTSFMRGLGINKL
jgi:hypothetical protein